eukprot:COSAG02_NODE_2849_length_7902_cov_2.924773_3_plen_306_part_00
MGDRSSLSLLGGQQELLRRVSAVAKKTIVVLVGGRPLTFEIGSCDAKKGNADLEIPPATVQDGVAFPWDPSESFGAACSQPSLLANVSALLAAWRPGAEGGPALFNILSGAVNPSAHLAVAWPRSVGGIGSQVPYLQQYALHYREQYQDEPTTPLFRFGYGLSYANVSSSAPRVVNPNVSHADTIDIAVDITNHSPRAATTVLQIYFQQMKGGAAVIRYYCQLVRFARTHIDAHSTKTVHVELKIADLSYWDNDEEGYLGTKGWRLGRPGARTTYNLMAGLQAPECTGSGACDLPGVQINFDVPA